MPKNFYDKVLDRNQMEMVHNNSVRILSEIGTDIYNDGVRISLTGKHIPPGIMQAESH